MISLASNVGGAIGSRFLKNHNRLVFTEYAGFLSKIDLNPTSTIVSQGTVTIGGTATFDCETGVSGASVTATADLFWEPVNNVVREMRIWNNSRIVNLGVVNFNDVTPATMPCYHYDTTPINGNNDATNKLVVNDVFCVLTNSGNYCKVQVLSYGYNLQVKYVTYKLAYGYAKLGSGYNQPEDLAVLANESTAYVTERPGNLLRVDLANANRSAATVVCTGLVAPQQLWVDEVNGQAYTVEFAPAGRLVRINLATGAKTYLYSGLNNAVGLVVASDLSCAYVGEQGLSAISRIDLTSGTKTVVATGLTDPFFLTWANPYESALLVPERSPANRISLVDISKTTGNVSPFITGTAIQPSSIAQATRGQFCICCNTEVDLYSILPTSGTYMGIGNVPWNLITAAGKADTTTQPAYLWQFPKDSPFGGSLSVMINTLAAYGLGIRHYKVKVDGNARNDSWTDLRLDPVTGYFDIPVKFQPDANGLYEIPNPAYVFKSTNLGCLLNSTNLPNGTRTLSVEFYDAANALVATAGNTLFIDNNHCVASLDMPNIGGVYADSDCGYLKYTNLTDTVTIHFSASEALGNADYYFSVIRGAGHTAVPAQSGHLPPSGVFNGTSVSTVQSMFGAACTAKGIAAFSIYLYVASSVIDGVGRLSGYDDSRNYAFCLAK